MPKQVRLRRGTTAQHASFTGADGEVTFDTTKKCLVLHDGITPGGKPLSGFLILNPGDPNALQVLQSKLQISGGTEDVAFQVDNFSQLNDVGVTGTLDVTGRTLVHGFGRVPFTLAYASVLTLDFYTQGVYQVTLAGNVTLATTGLAVGAQVLLKMTADGSLRTLTFPAGWKWLGSAAPANLAANKTALFEFTALGDTDSTVLASYRVEP